MPDPRRLPPPPSECANCGAAIPRQAKACPECGADERTGWRETADTLYDGLDLPEEAFADDRADGESSRRKPVTRVNGVPWYWWLVGVLLLLSLAAWALGLA